MNKHLLIIIAFIVTFLLAIVVFVGVMSYFAFPSTSHNECPPPEKPTIVPTEAVWCGGCDGGYWIEYVSDSTSAEYYRFRIYRDYDGVLEMDAYFKESDSIKMFDKDDWQQQVGYYYEGTDSLVYISLKESHNQNKLTIVYPAIGGEIWDIIKEKYKILDNKRN